MGTAAGVGEGAVLAGAVVLGSMAADELLADGDLDGVGDDGGRLAPADADRRCRRDRPHRPPRRSAPPTTPGLVDDGSEPDRALRAAPPSSPDPTPCAPPRAAWPASRVVRRAGTV